MPSWRKLDVLHLEVRVAWEALEVAHAHRWVLDPTRVDPAAHLVVTTRALVSMRTTRSARIAMCWKITHAHDLKAQKLVPDLNVFEVSARWVSAHACHGVGSLLDASLRWRIWRRVEGELEQNSNRLEPGPLFSFLVPPHSLALPPPNCHVPLFQHVSHNNCHLLFLFFFPF